MHIDLGSPEPIYLQLAREIRGRIVRGELAAGTQLPSGRQLEIELGISRKTYTEAIAELRREGLVSTRKGQGAFVIAVPALQVIPLRQGDRVLSRAPTQDERDRLAAGGVTWVLEITRADGRAEVHSAAVTVCVCG